jgi:hypothetical protein
MSDQSLESLKESGICGGLCLSVLDFASSGLVTFSGNGTEAKAPLAFGRRFGFGTSGTLDSLDSTTLDAGGGAKGGGFGRTAMSRGGIKGGGGL